MFLLILAIIVFVIIFISFFVGIPGSPWINSQKQQRRMLLKHLQLKKGDVFCDL